MDPAVQDHLFVSWPCLFVDIAAKCPIEVVL